MDLSRKPTLTLLADPSFCAIWSRARLSRSPPSTDMSASILQGQRDLAPSCRPLLQHIRSQPDSSRKLRIVRKHRRKLDKIAALLTDAEDAVNDAVEVDGNPRVLDIQRFQLPQVARGQRLDLRGYRDRRFVCRDLRSIIINRVSRALAQDGGNVRIDYVDVAASKLMQVESRHSSSLLAHRVPQVFLYCSIR